jgi:hypothetical protein
MQPAHPQINKKVATRFLSHPKGLKIPYCSIWDTVLHSEALRVSPIT